MFLGRGMQLKEDVPGVLALSPAMREATRRGLNLDAALGPGRIRLDQLKRLCRHAKRKYLKKN